MYYFKAFYFTWKGNKNDIHETVCCYTQAQNFYIEYYYPRTIKNNELSA